MSVPLDLSLISQLLTEQRTTGDLNNLTKPGFFYVTQPTNTPNEYAAWCHVINLVNYIPSGIAGDPLRIFQIYINDNRDDNTVWYRQFNNGWTDWERFVTATDLQNSTTKIDDQTTLSKWYGSLSYKDGASYKTYSVIPSAIIAQQTLTSDITFYFKFVLPAKPEYISDDHPRPLGIGTFASNLHEAVNTLSAKVILSRDSNTVIEPQLTIYNPNGGDFIYATRSTATGLFTDKAKSMFIATNTDQQPDAPEVEWGQTVIMAIRCHEVKNNPFQGA